MSDSRCLVNVATGQYYMRGQGRLLTSLQKHASNLNIIRWGDALPPGSPSHHVRPYAFKCAALAQAKKAGYRQLLWADSSIVAIAPLDRIWEYAARHGAWISLNGWVNADWCCDAAYPDLFPNVSLEQGRELNAKIPHVVATTFAIDLDHPIGAAIMTEYCRLGLETNAFAGPWTNSNKPGAPPADGWRCAPCGPPEVLGHRHDQTILSLLAHKCGVPLTSAPDFFAYAGGQVSSTIIVADGGHSIAI